MTVKNNNARLRELIKKHGLTRPETAALLHMKVHGPSGQVSGLAKWIQNQRQMPDAMLELLELKLGERKLTVRKPPKD